MKPMNFRPGIVLWLLGFSLVLTVINGEQHDGAIAQTTPSTATELPPFIQWTRVKVMVISAKNIP